MVIDSFYGMGLMYEFIGYIYIYIYIYMSSD